jgi:predicted Zn-dependent protease
MATMTMDFGGPRTSLSTRRATTAQASNTIRLTARGRLVVRGILAVFATLLVFTLLSLGKGAVVGAMTHAPQHVTAAHSIVVRSGETLWQIANRELPNTDPRDGIARIRTLNGMSTIDVLDAGQTIEIPTV